MPTRISEVILEIDQEIRSLDVDILHSRSVTKGLERARDQLRFVRNVLQRQPPSPPKPKLQIVPEIRDTKEP